MTMAFSLRSDQFVVTALCRSTTAARTPPSAIRSATGSGKRPHHTKIN